VTAVADGFAPPWVSRDNLKMQRASAGIGFLLCLLASAYAKKEFVQPPVHPAITYPAHDEHKKDQITAAADPYDTADKQEIFTVRYRDSGLLPVRLIITNDGSTPIALTSMKVELVTADKARLTPLDSEDLYRRLSRPQRNDRPSRIPLPFPRGGKPNGSVKSETLNEITNALFAAKAVEPAATQAGFLFFDVQGLSDPLAGAHLYLTGVRDTQGSELMFFDIPLDDYARRAH
jgi:hypothetical protein